MADISKLKRRHTLGAPPPMTEASHNLQAPEVAPPVDSLLQSAATMSIPVVPSVAAPLPQERPSPVSPSRRRLDGRSLRKTGRVLQFATRVSWEFDEKLRHIAQRDGLKLVEVLERALEAYEAARK